MTNRVFEHPLTRLLHLPCTLLCIVAGCGSTSDTPTLDMGSGGINRDQGMDIVCTPGAPTRYRITTLHIPTPAEANNGQVVGHNVDGTGEACTVEDYANGVDNALIDLAAALPGIDPADPVDLQAQIDSALDCPADAPTTQCTRLDLIVSVATGSGCVTVTVLDGEEGVLAGPFGASLDSDGNVRGTASELALAIPYQSESGPVDIDLAVTNVIMSATVDAQGLSNIVLGGVLEQAAFEQTVSALAPLLGFEASQITGLLSTLYDVDIDGSCTGLSVGLTGSATPVATP